MRGRYVLRRLLQSLIVLLGVSAAVFGLVHLSGDPAALMLPPEATPADVAEFRHQLGFDQPLPRQFALFLERALHGDLGRSLRYREPTLALVLERYPATLELALASLALACALALPLGVASAARRNSWIDNAAMLFALAGQSLPIFWLGIVLILVFSVALDLFPSSGRGGLEHLVLPAVALGLYSTARLTRLVRAGVLDVLGQDFVRTARAKGLAPALVLARHVLRNSMLPVVTLLGVELGTVLGGAVVTETVFAWPGVGRLVVRAIFDRDYPLLQAAVLVIACSFVLVNLAVDLSYTVLDPRIRLAR